VCGIVGIVAPPGRAVDPERLHAMTATLRHRGPDADGFLVEGNVGLGHRRLSIIDLSTAADEPLFNEDGTVAVIFNGEIYNFRELRRELEEAGHRFRTASDTEVLVHLWEECGPALVERLRGMFAFALWDRRGGRLLLARDRMGKKPLYYTRAGGELLFASEPKALLAHPGVSREIEPRAVGELMVYGNVVGPGSAFRGICQLPPACRMTVETGCSGSGSGGAPEPSVERYWAFRPRPEPPAATSEEEWLERLDGTLAEAVRLRLTSDVPLGAFLSGGIDSSLVVAHMVREAPGRVRTFTVGFREAGWDESAHAQAVADHLGTEHHRDVVTPDAVAVLPELIATYDEPFADPSAIPTYYLCRETRRHVTVALSGDGGDELFFGYRRYVESSALERWGRRLTPPGRRLAGRTAALLPTGAYLGRALGRIAQRDAALYLDALGFSPVYRSLLGPEVRRALGSAAEQKATADFEAPEGVGFLQRCRATDVETYLPDQILVKVDRAAMRHSLEVRCPLLDQEVVALAERLPAAEQMRGRRQKLLLRRLAYRHVPRRLLERPKQGFSVPLARWFRHELAPLVETLLAERDAPVWSWLDREAVERRFAHHRRGRLDAATALWRVLILDRWSREHGGMS